MKNQKYKRYIKTQHTYLRANHPLTCNKDENTTIPGETYTINDLIRRHSQGLQDNLGKEPIFQDQDDISHNSHDWEKISRLDLVDKSEISEENINALRELRQKLVEKGKKKPSDDVKTKNNTNIPQTQKTDTNQLEIPND